MGAVQFSFEGVEVVGVDGVVFGDVFAGGAAFVDSLFEVFEFVVGVVVFGAFLEAWEQVAADGVEFGGAGVVGGGEVFECPAVEVGALVVAALLDSAVGAADPVLPLHAFFGHGAYVCLFGAGCGAECVGEAGGYVGFAGDAGAVVGWFERHEVGAGAGIFATEGVVGVLGGVMQVGEHFLGVVEPVSGEVGEHFGCDGVEGYRCGGGA